MSETCVHGIKETRIPGLADCWSSGPVNADLPVKVLYNCACCHSQVLRDEMVFGDWYCDTCKPGEESIEMSYTKGGIAVHKRIYRESSG